MQFPVSIRAHNIGKLLRRHTLNPAILSSPNKCSLQPAKQLPGYSCNIAYLTSTVKMENRTNNSDQTLNIYFHRLLVSPVLSHWTN